MAQNGVICSLGGKIVRSSMVESVVVVGWVPLILKGTMVQVDCRCVSLVMKSVSQYLGCIWEGGSAGKKSQCVENAVSEFLREANKSHERNIDLLFAGSLVLHENREGSDNGGVE